jgi:hypothetical protein
MGGCENVGEAKQHGKATTGLAQRNRHQTIVELI